MGPAMRIGSLPKHNLKGFTYIGLMIIVAISGIAMAGVATVWHQDMQREREKQLLFAGNEIAHAISSYYKNSPSAAKQYPLNFNDLLLDKRLPVIKRHLRKIYLDPITNTQDWGLIQQQNRITGVYSKSELTPIKKTGFLEQYKNFARAKKYSEWKFLASAITTLPAAVNTAEVELSSTENENKNARNASGNNVL